jgi:L-ascorbate metabolism protein UlaG (beta-lactamase superfamily)
MITAHQYITNPDLDIIKEDWKGNPITKKGRFLNHEHPFIPSFKEIIKWKSRANPDANQKRNDTWRLPVEKIEDLSRIQYDTITWLGHASFLIKIKGLTILTDPILYTPGPFMPRFAKFPIVKTALKGIDLILISHDHRDHVDARSLKLLFKQNPKATVYTGLNMKPLLEKWTVQNPIVEAGWFQRLPVFEGLNITFLPCRHWGKRWLNDTNRRLWGSFMLESEKWKVFYGSDSGYGSHYKDIQDLFEYVDVAMVGIGAYKPEWFMHPSHTSPRDAYQIALDLNSRALFPMHYGTFDLSDEAISDPYRNIQKVVKEEKNGPGLILGHPGETYALSSVSTLSKAKV